MIFHRMSSVFLYKKAEVFFCLSFYPKAAAVFSAQAERGVHKLRTRFILSGRLLLCTG